MYNQDRLARSIQRQFTTRIVELEKMTPDEMRRLGFPYVFTYIPTERTTDPSESLEPDLAYLDIMLEGAMEHRIEELVSQLKNLR
jgi:hypothetical protein